MDNDTTVTVRINATDSTAAVDEARGRFAGLWKQVGGGMIAAQLAQDAFQKVKEGVDLVKNSAEQWQNQQAATAAALKSTHDASGISKQDAIDYAEAIAKQTPVTREAVLAGENMILTFTNIHKEVMPQTTQAITDMATAMNHGLTPSAGDLTHTAIMVGKALQDPEHGLTRLMRVGVAFTEKQKEQIKTLQESGHVTEAQKVILAELAKEFGGRATAAAQTWQGRMTMVKNTLVDMTVNGMQRLGSWLQKIADQVYNFLKPSLEALLKQVETLTPTLTVLWRDILKPIAEVLGVALVAATWLFINVLRIAIIAFKDLTEWGLTAARKVQQAWSEHILPFFKQLWSNMKQWAKDAINDIMKVWEDLKNKVSSVINAIAGFLEKHKKGLTDIAIVIGTIVAPAIAKIAIQMGITAVQAVIAATRAAASWVASAATASYAWVTQTLPKLIASFAATAVKAAINAAKIGATFVLQAAKTTAAWVAAFAKFIAGMVVMVAQFLVQAARMAAGWLLALGPIGALVAVAIGAAALIVTHWKAVSAFFKRAWSDIKQWAKDAFNFLVGLWGSITGFFSRTINNVKNLIINGVKGFGNLLYNAGHDLIDGLVRGVEAGASRAVNAVKNVGKDIIKGARDVLKWFSPSQVFVEAGKSITAGLAKGLVDTADLPVTATQNITQSMVNVTPSGGVPTTTSKSYDYSQSNKHSYYIDKLVMPPGSTLKQVLQGINQDAINTGKGLSVVQGAY